MVVVVPVGEISVVPAGCAFACDGNQTSSINAAARAAPAGTRARRGDIVISLSIALAIIINLFFAAAAGTLLPLILRKMGVDPALAGGVILTTVTDCMGFLSFLGLATVFYIYLPQWLG